MKDGGVFPIAYETNARLSYQNGLSKRELISIEMLKTIVAYSGPKSNPEQDVRLALEYTNELMKQTP
jgi:hypothetical protein